MLFSETSESLELNQCAVREPTRLGVTLKLQSTEKDWPATELIVLFATTGFVSSVEVDNSQVLRSEKKKKKTYSVLLYPLCACSHYWQ